MELAQFADMVVVDGHIHFSRPEFMHDVLAVMDQARLTRVNLVSVLDWQAINHNPALVHFKMHHPDRAYICGALDYSQYWKDSELDPHALAQQVGRLHDIGFDGLKMIEGKPTVRKLLGIPLDGPEYAPFWRAVERWAMPVVLHVADPEEFWDAERCPDWAFGQGWFFGDGSYPQQEALYAEVDSVLERHPDLRLIMAHFYFLSADLERAAAFLDVHPQVCFDLTPGVEMYVNFARDPAVAREFFLRYQDRLIYGTDIGASAMLTEPEQGLDRTEALGRTWIVRCFLETDQVFAAPAGLGHGLGLDSASFHSICLPTGVLQKIYSRNAERVFGLVPAPLEPAAALAELERMADMIDALAGGQPVDSPARRVAHSLAARRRAR